jgi:hypothetical protein
MRGTHLLVNDAHVVQVGHEGCPATKHHLLGATFERSQCLRLDEATRVPRFMEVWCRRSFFPLLLSPPT